ncbi:phosphate ABC transporter membrane protein 2, PhoT family [Thermodesulfobium acidiphilum]|uniref:Phosphate transport system permease protein PstA n=1 Tax=Thermodesulfobium acidiphilum TaxID=1794699 RepID=A0A2R4W1X1_THEAF|nr:phosphate ABC transporter permease PstA [Thermodesulfobium acidiphilum]AWB10803.1 phosphate ABC transporter membrane protein 2, PhoT family [Thermodesulfobium acidiphilum]PMP84685.1 MAG: phosphate ABC transporter, permease protein PstA [Thermodesulfobium narugense]
MRFIIDKVFQIFTLSVAIFVSLVLAFILFQLIKDGISSLSINFFTETARPVGSSSGGFKQAIVGSIIIDSLAMVIIVSLSILGGLYLHLYSGSLFAKFLKEAMSLLQGTPTIVCGICVYYIVVKQMGHFSGLAGSIALALVGIPYMVLASEQIFNMTPTLLLEAAYSLGLSRTRVIFYVVLRFAKFPLLAISLLTLARIAGETAPLLFTAFGNSFLELNPTRPMAAIPLQIFIYAISPYDEWHRLAWAGALVLITFVTVLSIILGRYRRLGE